MLPIFARHVMWRPKAREWIGGMMASRDAERLREDLEEGVKMASSLGIDVSDVHIPS
jgi:hypothetical protein